MLRSPLVLSLLVLCLLAAACTTGPGPVAAPTAPPTDAPTAAPATAAPATEAPATATAEPSMAATEAVSIGPDGYFVGHEGHTLYLFDNDEPGVSNCTGECLVNWPPLLVASAQVAVGAGLDTADFATITLDDGALQVTYQQMPLYFFIGDAVAGDTNGDGVNDVWHIVTAESAASAAPDGPAIDY